MKSNDLKEVYFDEYCKNCEHEERPEDTEPCSTCLTNPVNEFSHKPTEYKRK